MTKPNLFSSCTRTVGYMFPSFLRVCPYTPGNSCHHKNQQGRRRDVLAIVLKEIQNLSNDKPAISLVCKTSLCEYWVFFIYRTFRECLSSFILFRILVCNSCSSLKSINFKIPRLQSYALSWFCKFP